MAVAVPRPDRRIGRQAASRPPASSISDVLGADSTIAESAPAPFLLRQPAAVRRLLEAEESERSRLARDLHDVLGQALTAIRINLERSLRRSDSHALRVDLEESIRIVDVTLRQVRGFARELRPSELDDIGLRAALSSYLDQVARRSGMSARFVSDGLRGGVAHELETACFRVAQEALTNVARHASARHVDLALRTRGRTLELVVSDDGVGFDVDGALTRAAHGESLGLVGMQERLLLLGGTIQIASVPGYGTRLCARLPLDGRPITMRGAR